MLDALSGTRTEAALHDLQNLSGTVRVEIVQESSLPATGYIFPKGIA